MANIPPLPSQKIIPSVKPQPSYSGFKLRPTPCQASRWDKVNMSSTKNMHPRLIGGESRPRPRNLQIRGSVPFLHHHGKKNKLFSFCPRKTYREATAEHSSGPSGTMFGSISAELCIKTRALVGHVSRKCTVPGWRAHVLWWIMAWGFSDAWMKVEMAIYFHDEETRLWLDGWGGAVRVHYPLFSSFFLLFYFPLLHSSPTVCFQ